MVLTKGMRIRWLSGSARISIDARLATQRNNQQHTIHQARIVFASKEKISFFVYVIIKRRIRQMVIYHTTQRKRTYILQTSVVAAASCTTPDTKSEKLYIRTGCPRDVSKC